MPTYRLEWRQPVGRGSGDGFLHRTVSLRSPIAVKEIVEGLGDRAWHREFRLGKGGDEVYTDLQAILTWDAAATPLPRTARNHIWRSDLERALSADRFLCSIDGCTAPAVAAGVLLGTDAARLVGFARSIVRRPGL